jgi:gliding motility-associated-like protein
VSPYIPDWQVGDKKISSGYEFNFCEKIKDFTFYFNFESNEEDFKKRFHSSWSIDGVPLTEEWSATIPLIDKDCKITHTVTDGVCPPSVFDFNFKVSHMPEVELTASSTRICEGTEVDLKATVKNNSTDVTWMRMYDNEFRSKVLQKTPSDAVLSYQPTQNGLYWLKVPSDGVCPEVLSDFVRVEIEPIYVPQWSSSDGPFKSGDTINFCGPFDDFYFRFGSVDNKEFIQYHTSLWKINGINQSTDFSFRTDLSSSCVITQVVSSKTCPDVTTDFVMIINPVPVLELSADDDKVCDGASTKLKLKYENVDEIAWQRSSLLSATNHEGTFDTHLTDQLEVTPQKDERFRVVGLNEYCYDYSNEFSFDVWDSVFIHVQNDVVPDQNGNAELSVCKDDPLLLENAVSGIPTFWKWRKNGHEITDGTSKERYSQIGNETSDDTLFFDLSDVVNSTADYEFEVGNQVCPSAVVKYHVIAENHPSVKLSDVTICEGESVDLKAETNDSDLLYEWYDESMTDLLSTEETLNVTPSSDVSYVLRATNKNNCVTEKNVKVSVGTIPVITDYKKISNISYLMQTEGGTGGLTFDYGDRVSQSPMLNNALMDKEYHVKVMDELGCSSEFDFKTEAVNLKIPEYFIANYTTWLVENLYKYDDVKIDIYDRFGRLMFSTTDALEGWDGSYQGTPMPSTDYWYVINIADIDKQYTGHLTLMRE